MVYRFPPANLIIRAILEPLQPEVPESRPGDVEQLDKFIVAYKSGGQVNGNDSQPLVAVEVYAKRYDVGEPLAFECMELVLDAPNREDGLASYVDSVNVVMEPIEIPYGGGSTRCWTASYRLAYRRASV